MWHEARQCVRLGAIVATLVATGAAGWCADEVRTPAHCVITEGIVGGFVPPHVRSQVIVLANKNGYEVFLLRQPQRNAPKQLHGGKLTAAQFAWYFRQLDRAGLWQWPREVPTGCEDIYKLDTSIHARAGTKLWRNGGPEGCVHGKSRVTTTPEQRAAFARLAKALRKEAEQQATEEIGAEAFAAARRAVARQTPSKKNPAPEKPSPGKTATR